MRMGGAMGGANFHSYADDTQLYKTLDRDVLSNCIIHIKLWIAENFLQLN